MKATSAWTNKKESLEADVKARENLIAGIADGEKQLAKQQKELVKAQVRMRTTHAHDTCRSLGDDTPTIQAIRTLCK